MKRFALFGVFALIGVIVSLFTVSSKDVQRYNDAMVDTVGQVDQAFTLVLPYMETYSNGEAIVIDDFAHAVTEMGTRIDTNIALVQAHKVPDDEACRTFHASLLDYANNSKAIHAVYVDKLVPYIREHNPGTEADVEILDGFFGDLIAKDGTLLERVQSTQQAMASKHKMKLQ